MKNCPACGAAMSDDTLFCTACGSRFPEAAPVNQPQTAEPVAPAQNTYVPPMAPPVPPVMPGQPQYAPAADPADHTAEFTAEDVSKHKVYALLVYVAGIVGIIPALLIGKDSPYLMFHVRQKVMLMVATMLVVLIGSLTSILILPIFVAGIVTSVLSVVNIICIYKTATGKSVEAPIVKDIKFFK